MASLVCGRRDHRERGGRRRPTDFETLYEQYAADVFRFTLYLCGERAEAEDITAETFVRAWTASEPVRTATAKAYLLTIARNLHLKRVRSLKRTVELDERHRDRQLRPDTAAELAESLTAVIERLQTVPEIDRAALLMSAVEGIPYEDIARSLGISLSAVKVKIHRTRLKLSDLRELYVETLEDRP
jgi:RNA polymerase sigma-70 factor, ECF subfamily